MKDYIEIDGPSVLKVCLCANSCKNNASLKELLTSGMNVLIHYIDNKGDITALTEQKVREILATPKEGD